MHYLFDKHWFEEHQRKLLPFFNIKIIRRILKIYKDIPVNKKVINITPNSITWIDKIIKKRIYCKTDFRTDNTYSKKLFYSFYPIWYLFHTWDMVINFLKLPALNLGFDTLTVYPDAGDPGTTSMDGQLLSDRTSVTTWANLRASATNAGRNTLTSGNFIRLLEQFGGWRQLMRAWFGFDTSSLDPSTVISSAILSFHGNGNAIANEFTSDIVLIESTQASNTTLVTGDWAKYGSTELAPRFAFSSWDKDNYNAMSLNPAGIANINKAGVTKYAILESHDYDNDEPVLNDKDASIQGYWSDYGSNEPKLVITHAIAVATARTQGYIF